MLIVIAIVGSLITTYIAVALVPGPQLGKGFSWNRTNPCFLDWGFASGCISKEYSRSGSVFNMLKAGVFSTCRFLLTGCFFAQHRIISHITLAGALVFTDVLFMCV